MVSRLALAGWLIFVFGSGSEAVPAQQPVPAPAKPAATTAPAGTAPTPSAKKTSIKGHKAAKKQQKEQVAAPVVQAPPPPPPSPEDSPASTPQVTFQDGQLSIRSENSTLASILSAVKARTGATVDGPGISSSDRVATQLGPGDPRDVLTTLLISTKYDFMLVGTTANPKAVQKIILAARASGGSTAASAPQQQASQSFQAPTDQPDPDQTLPDAEIPDESTTQVVEEPPQPEQPEQPVPQAAPNGLPGQPNGLPGQQPPGAEGEQNPNQPKSPEQLLQELQRMQQQQQQQQPPQRPE